MTNSDREAFIQTAGPRAMCEYGKHLGMSDRDFRHGTFQAAFLGGFRCGFEAALAHARERDAELREAAHDYFQYRSAFDTWSQAEQEANGGKRIEKVFALRKRVLTLLQQDDPPSQGGAGREE